VPLKHARIPDYRKLNNINSNIFCSNMTHEYASLNSLKVRKFYKSHSGMDGVWTGVFRWTRQPILRVDCQKGRTDWAR